jgi:hypothetical protein
MVTKMKLITGHYTEGSLFTQNIMKMPAITSLPSEPHALLREFSHILPTMS